MEEVIPISVIVTKCSWVCNKLPSSCSYWDEAEDGNQVSQLLCCAVIKLVY